MSPSIPAPAGRRFPWPARMARISLIVKDFGRGFDPARSKKRGLGLISMEERVRQAGGVFTLKTTPGEGVRIDVRIPLPQQKTGRKALES